MNEYATFTEKAGEAYFLRKVIWYKFLNQNTFIGKAFISLKFDYATIIPY